MEILPAEKLLDLARKRANQVEVSFAKGRSRTIWFEDDKLKTITADFSSNIGLRLIRNGRVGVAATNKLEELSDLVGRAVATSDYGPKAFFTFPQPGEFYEPEVYDKEVGELPGRFWVEKGQQIIERIKDYNPQVLVDLGFEIGEGESVLLNSANLEVRKKASAVSFWVEGKLIREGDFLQIVEANSSHRLGDLNFDFYLERLLDKFSKARRLVKIRPGRYPVVFTPESFGSVLNFITRALNGKMIVKKSSRLLDKLGEKVFDERLTIVDDGTLDWKMGSEKCDSEGVPVRPLALVEGGVVRNFYYDLQTAGQMKVESTGHGSRGRAAALASPSLHNVLVKGGKRSYHSILKSIKQGILVEQLLGVGQDNPFNGDFAYNLWLGYKIEDGEIVGRVKDTMIAGNAFELLGSGVGEISKETEWVGNSFRCPYVMLEGLAVSSKE